MHNLSKLALMQQMRAWLWIGIISLIIVSKSPLRAQVSLSALDSALLVKEQYEEAKLQRIHKLYRRLQANEGADIRSKFDICNQLYHQYKSFVFDSAFQYGKQMIDLSYEMESGQLIGYCKTNLGFTLLSAGMFKEAFDTLNSVVVSDLHDSTRIEYYALMARMLYDIADHNRDKFYSPKYVKNADVYVDFATNLADPNSYHHLYLSGLRDLRIDRTDEAIDYLDRLMTNSELDGHRFAITASTLSYLHLKLGDTTRAIQLLADASVSDIKNAIKETSALTSLAQLLYQTGEGEAAYRYINESMKDAQYYGAIQRMSQVGHILPIISSAKLNNVEGQRSKLLILSVGLTLLAVLTFGFALLNVVQKRRISGRDKIIKGNNDQLREANALLSEINSTKDEYLGFYFDLSAKYLGKMSKIKESIEDKLSEKRYDDIRYILRKADLNQERKDLFTHFDESFIKIFPNYVAQFNALFDGKEQFVPDKGEILSTELRLFALIRIGIKDSDRLASILGYSVNTIYAYKNRIKNQSAIPNNEFEDRVMEIQAG